MTKSFDDLLRATLKMPVAEPPDGCLDAGLLAAWFEGTLDPAGRAAAEAHAAGCSRCQAVLAAMIRIEPPMESRPWWRSPAFGWLVPLTVAAAALVVYVRMERDPGAVQVAMAPAVAPAPVPPASGQAAATEPAVKAERDAAVPRSVPAAPSSTRAVPKDTDRLEPLAKSREKFQETPQEKPAMSAPSAAPSPAEVPQLEDRVASGDAPVPQKTAPAPPPAAAAGPPAAPAAPEKTSQPGVVVTATEERARADAAARANLAESVLVNAVGGSAGFRQPQIVVQTSDGSTRWRTVAPGSVQRSIDAGSTWETQSTGVAAIISSGAAPSKSVCWLVGKAGVVLLSPDGRSWRRVLFPEAVDLVSVAATDANSAAVTTVTGRTFTTTDGGKTWK